MRSFLLFASALLAGCAGVSTVPYDGRPMGQASVAGTPYHLPKGLVSVDVISDESGIAVNVGQVNLVTDRRVGLLVARNKPSPFNDEKIQVNLDKKTGFLNSVSTDSTAKLKASIEESAKLAGRLAFQNAKINFLKDKTKYTTEQFDPLDQNDLDRANRNINDAIARAAQSVGGRQPGSYLPQVQISLVDPEPRLASPDASTLPNCQLGVCVRAMTIRTLRIAVDGATIDTKNIHLPSREIIPLPVPQTILSDQKIEIQIEDGMLTSYHLDRKSEVYGFVQAIGAIPGAFIQGALGALDDRSDVAKKGKEVVIDEKEEREAKAAAAKSTVELQNASFRGSNAYSGTVTTIYPFPSSQKRALSRQRTGQPPVTPSPREKDFTDPPSAPKG